MNFLIILQFYTKIVVLYNFSILKFLRIFLENRNFFFFFFSLLLNISLNLEFQGGIRVQSLEILLKWIARAWRTLFFQKFLLLWNKIPRFRKICRFSCNVWQFLSICRNFLLPIASNYFLILPKIENCEICPIFAEIIAYVGKKIMHLKITNHQKSSYF